MKKPIMILLSLCFIFLLTACGKQTERQSEPGSLEAVQESEDFETEPSKEDEALPEDTDQIRVRLTFDERMEDTTQMDVNDQKGTTAIRMSVDDTVITAELSDSGTTRAFLETLPRTLTMNRYGDREYYGRIEEIAESGEAIPDFENGNVTYYSAGPSFAVFFGGEESSNQGGLIRMGRITFDLSVFDTLGESVEMLIEIAE